MASRLLRLKRSDTCSDCGRALEVDTTAWWDGGTRTVTCVTCGPAADAAPPERGEAGASTAREHERRKAARETRTREAHPIIGEALLALRSAPQHEVAFRRGAAGERAVGERLDERLADGHSVVLHDRRMPGGRGNIDHLVVAPTGVYVVDAKDVQGKVRVAAPLFGATKLLVDGRDRTKLIDGLDRQVAAVKAAVVEHGASVDVRGILCFTRADLPLLGTTRMCGHELLYRKALVARLSAAGDLDAGAIDALARHLARVFPPA